MGIWVFVMFVSGVTSTAAGGLASVAIEFDSLARCEAGRQAMLGDLARPVAQPSPLSNAARVQLVTDCVQTKGPA